MSVTTPTDTAWIVRPARARALARGEAATSREAAFASRGLRIEAAVATSRGLRHAENEDCHSPLDGRSPLFVVADGVGGGALASRASRELVSRLHATLDAAVTSPDTVR